MLCYRTIMLYIYIYIYVYTHIHISVNTPARARHGSPDATLAARPVLVRSNRDGSKRGARTPCEKCSDCPSCRPRKKANERKSPRLLGRCPLSSELKGKDKRCLSITKVLLVTGW